MLAATCREAARSGVTGESIMKAISASIIVLAGVALVGLSGQLYPDAQVIAMIAGAVLGLVGLVAWKNEMSKD
jgi:hypothetical protein